ncbi:MAG: response regulator [Elusimicrobiales bacterium]|jgi:DNA-binding NtrC family response regulator
MNHRILLVDDQEDILAALRRILEDYPVTEARDGKTALALIKAEKPALVILDVSMPEMSGIEVLEKILLMDHKPLVLMLTGDDAIETAAKTLAIGAFAYITKPFEIRQIREQVAKALAFSDRKPDGGKRNA